MSGATDLQLLRGLVERLDSDDAFDRREAIERLAVLTQRRFGYAWRDEPDVRAESISRWKRWLAREEKQRRGTQIQATLQALSSGKVTAESLQDLPPQQKMMLIKHVLQKAGTQNLGGLPPCGGCQKRPATVKVTERGPDGSYAQSLLCEVCAGAEGH